MSTILDALKKSEQERKLNKLPTLNDMQAPQEPSRWPLLIGVLLSLVAIAALGATFIWWQSTNPEVSQKPKVKVISNETIGQAAAVIEAPAVDDEVVINAVSYAQDPAQRFAMIDGKVVREGEFVRAGLMLEKIQSNSVVLNLRGKQITRTP